MNNEIKRTLRALSSSTFFTSRQPAVATRKPTNSFGPRDSRPPLPQHRRGGITGIHVTRNLTCPPLDKVATNTLDGDGPELVTKYLTKEGYEFSKLGSFRFGTLLAYRSNEVSLKSTGRFTDEQEGTQQHIFNSRSGYFNSFKYSGVHIKNTIIQGMDNDVVVEFQANAYCACVSQGAYDPRQMSALKQNGNSDITHFVTYDLKRLRGALSDLIASDDEWKDCSLIGRPIIYGAKDRHWEVEDSFSDDNQRAPLAIFMGLAFVKDKARFEHENEYRLMIVNSLLIGQLKADAAPHAFEHESIAACIVACGELSESAGNAELA
ncbi:hypothetical protein [Brucella intermedia]|uniref:hypothetical protein n=1 Tax=Brucella intermedia TaxID=94625 RepID=UPI00244CA4DB|nr:hypothetical protein [Brucella intermedia]WGG58193.1 hypothetical protein QA414_07405 [Brucella intermedia]